MQLPEDVIRQWIKIEPIKQVVWQKARPGSSHSEAELNAYEHGFRDGMGKMAAMLREWRLAH